MPRIYTKTGDDGLTGLLGAGRVAKDDRRIEAYGTVDELNAWLGLARSHGLDARLDGWLGRVQDDLFTLGSALADPDPLGRFHRLVTEAHAQHLEGMIDVLESELPPLRTFILPGGPPGAATLHVARTVCRRAERRVIALSHAPGEHVPGPIVVYLNRLSDLLFVLARAVNRTSGVPEVPWQGG